jgi:O-antigen ligase
MSTLEMASAERQISGLRLNVAEGLWRLAVVALAIIPLAMAVAHRSSVFFLVLAALSSVCAVVAEGQLRQVFRDAGSRLKSPLGLAVLAFLGWSLASVSWSEFKGASLQALGEFWLSVASGFIAGLVLPRRMTRLAFWLLTALIAAACILMVFELKTGMAYRQMLGMRWNSYIFNRPTLTVLILTLPLLVWLSNHMRHGWACGLAVVLIAGGTALYSDSGAANLGLFVACLALVAAWLSPRLTGRLMAASLAIALAAAPVFGTISDRMIPASVHEYLVDGHSRERVDVWLSFGAAIREHPILGAGFGVSPRMADTAVAREVPEERRAMLAVGHPHNIAVQIWTELGVVGAALALVIVLLVLRSIRHQPHLIMCASLALMAGAAAVALVGHGAWQGWWAASLGASITWMLAARRTWLETRP